MRSPASLFRDESGIATVGYGLVAAALGMVLATSIPSVARTLFGIVSGVM